MLFLFEKKMQSYFHFCFYISSKCKTKSFLLHNLYKELLCDVKNFIYSIFNNNNSRGRHSTSKISITPCSVSCIYCENCISMKLNVIFDTIIVIFELNNVVSCINIWCLCMCIYNIATVKKRIAYFDKGVTTWFGYYVF